MELLLSVIPSSMVEAELDLLKNVTDLKISLSQPTSPIWHFEMLLLHHPRGGARVLSDLSWQRSHSD